MGRWKSARLGPTGRVIGEQDVLVGRSCLTRTHKHIMTLVEATRVAAWLDVPAGNEASWSGWHQIRCDRNDGHTVDALALDADEGRGHATKCSGEALAAGDPEISEWGNPAGVMACHPELTGGEPGELKHLSTPRKREDALSSGERTGQSPNRGGVRAGVCAVAPGLNDPDGGDTHPSLGWTCRQTKCAGTAHHRG